MRVTLKRLRYEMRGWSWIAERYNMGWVYIGRRQGKEVRIQPYAVHCGPAEDDYTTQWRVDDGETSKPYASWYLENRETIGETI